MKQEPPEFHRVSGVSAIVDVIVYVDRQNSEVARENLEFARRPHLPQENARRTRPRSRPPPPPLYLSIVVSDRINYIDQIGKSPLPSYRNRDTRLRYADAQLVCTPNIL